MFNYPLVMEKTHSLKLIEGQFTPSQTRNVLLDLISHKIRYHNLEALSIQERFNGDISYSEKRIAELKQISILVEEIVRFASEEGLNLKIESFIQIELIKSSTP